MAKGTPARKAILVLRANGHLICSACGDLAEPTRENTVHSCGAMFDRIGVEDDARILTAINVVRSQSYSDLKFIGIGYPPNGTTGFKVTVAAENFPF